jgi:hypothetical protein
LIKRTAHIVFSAWLAILLLFGTTAKEFVHQFADHEDTVHCNNRHDGTLVIEPEHHHCKFLSFSLAAFISPVYGYTLPAEKIFYSTYVAAPVAHIAHRTVTTPCLRGPPAPSFV